jgi:hypothetical protein
MKYELLIELTNRVEAELLESYLEANDVDVELFQESAGHLYPVAIGGILARIQVFVQKEKIENARKLLNTFKS